jgi:hypothetical protein
MVKKTGVLAIALIFTFTIFSSRTLAQSSAGLESRLSRLEAETFKCDRKSAPLSLKYLHLGDNHLPKPQAQLDHQPPQFPPEQIGKCRHQIPCLTDSLL